MLAIGEGLGEVDWTEARNKASVPWETLLFGVANALVHSTGERLSVMLLDLVFVILTSLVKPSNEYLGPCPG